jgi:hypothetical protein
MVNNRNWAMIIHSDQEIAANDAQWNKLFQWGLEMFWENSPPRLAGPPQISARGGNRGDFFAFPLNFQLCRSQTNDYISLIREKQMYPVVAELYRNGPLRF